MSSQLPAILDLLMWLGQDDGCTALPFADKRTVMATVVQNGEKPPILPQDKGTSLSAKVITDAVRFELLNLPN